MGKCLNSGKCKDFTTENTIVDFINIKEEEEEEENIEQQLNINENHCSHQMSDEEMCFSNEFMESMNNIEQSPQMIIPFTINNKRDLNIESDDSIEEARQSHEIKPIPISMSSSMTSKTTLSPSSSSSNLNNVSKVPSSISDIDIHNLNISKSN